MTIMTQILFCSFGRVAEYFLCTCLPCIREGLWMEHYKFIPLMISHCSSSCVTNEHLSPLIPRGLFTSAHPTAESQKKGPYLILLKKCWNIIEAEDSIICLVLISVGLLLVLSTNWWTLQIRGWWLTRRLCSKISVNGEKHVEEEGWDL